MKFTPSRMLLVIIVSLVSLVLLASCGSSDGPNPEGNSSAADGTVIQITARNTLFDRQSLSAPANTAVTIRFDNQDAGILHNVAIYTDSTAATKIFVGELITGRKKIDYQFTTPAPGTYFYRCDVHPTQMTGTLTAQ